MLDLEQLAVRRLERLADAQRREGRLDEARGTVERLLSMAPDHWRADRLLASLSDRPPGLPARPDELTPAPFVRVPAFLPPGENAAWLETFVALAHRFLPASIGRTAADGSSERAVDPDYRRSQCLRDVFDYVDPALERSFRAKLGDGLSAVCERLRVRPFDLRRVELQALIYRDGDFFAAHRDIGWPGNTRRITLAYYLHALPRRFTGGDLVLYDTFRRPGPPTLEEPGFEPAAFTRIPSANNELVCFPSEFYHAATPVTGVGDDVRDARMAIVGWVHTTEEDGDPASLASTPY